MTPQRPDAHDPAGPERLPTAGPRHLALVGATASGKSAVAMEVARALGDVEIVAVDSMQVYRGMDIGTAKPSPVEQAEIAHHCIDLVDPWDEFSVHDYQRAATSAISRIEGRGRRALLVGGTGLYLQAVVDGLDLPGRWPAVRARLEQEPDTQALYAQLAERDPLAASRMEPSNRRRVLRALEVTIGSGRPFSSYGPGIGAYPPARFDIVGLRLANPSLVARIEARCAAQLAAGLLEEVRRLDQPPAGRRASRTASQALGYKELLAHLHGELSLEEAIQLVLRRTRTFARRQRAWFTRDPRICWLDVDDPLEAVPVLLERWRRKPPAETGRGAARLGGS